MYIDSSTLEEVSDTVYKWLLSDSGLKIDSNSWGKKIESKSLDSAEVSDSNACLFFSLGFSTPPSPFFFLFAWLTDWQMQRK